MTSESDMRAVGVFATDIFPVERFDRATFGAPAFDTDDFPAAGLATLEDSVVVLAATFFTGFFKDFFVGM